MSIKERLEFAEKRAEEIEAERIKNRNFTSSGHTKTVLRMVLDYAESTNDVEEIRNFIKGLLKEESAKREIESNR